MKRELDYILSVINELRGLESHLQSDFDFNTINLRKGRKYLESFLIEVQETDIFKKEFEQ